MEKYIITFLNQRNIESSRYDLNTLSKVGLEHVMKNIEYYFDKSYTCESVLKELFQ